MSQKQPNTRPGPGARPAVKPLVISGDAFSGKPAAYAGKSLHVAITHGARTPHYAVWTNDGDAPIATCIDAGTAHLLVAAQNLLQALRMIVLSADAGDPEEIHDYESIVTVSRKKIEAARAAIAKAAP